MPLIQKSILATAFEEIDGQWVWYANAWSRGIIVSPEEREIFLSFRPVEFRRAMAGRTPSYPRRPYFKTVLRSLALIVTGRSF